MKAHDITVATPRKGAASKSNGGDADDNGEPKTPASKKRKRAGVKKDEDDDTPVKNEKARIKAEKGRAGLKKEESDDDDVKVKGEADGSLHTPAAATVSCCDGGGGGGGGGGFGGGDVRMSDIPDAYPQRQCSDGHRPADEDDDDACVIVGERPVSASTPAPAMASAAYADGHTHSHNHGMLPTPNFGHHHHALYCRDTNLALPLQTMTTWSSSIIEPGIHDAATPSFGSVNWGVPPNTATPSEFYSGKQRLLQ